MSRTSSQTVDCERLKGTDCPCSPRVGSCSADTVFNHGPHPLQWLVCKDKRHLSVSLLGCQSPTGCLYFLTLPNALILQTPTFFLFYHLSILALSLSFSALSCTRSVSFICHQPQLVQPQMQPDYMGCRPT